MNIQSLLTPKRTHSNLEASSKKNALELLAQIIGEDIPEIAVDDLIRRFLARERLGSTGVGHGVAIPHCRIGSAETGDEKNAIGALITLQHPVEFDSVDNHPVDILFAMLVPEDSHSEHLKNLAALASTLTRSEFRQRLRAATDDITLYQAAIS